MKYSLETIPQSLLTQIFIHKILKHAFKPASCSAANEKLKSEVNTINNAEGAFIIKLKEELKTFNLKLLQKSV